MKVLSRNYTANISFGRAPSPNREAPDFGYTGELLLNPISEEQDYGNTIASAKKVAGIEKLALIIHGSSFPGGDLFIGSPINKDAADFDDFAKLHGYDSIQLGPPGLIKKNDHSPYGSTINSKNYLFADMDKFTTDEYANILDKEDIEIESSESFKKSTMTDFESALDSYDRLFEKAYDNLYKSKQDKNAQKLIGDFKKFEAKAGDWLETDSLFEVLKSRYHTSDIEKWPNIARNLITYRNDPENPNHQKAVAIINKLKETKSKDIELYKFKQFIIDKQEKEFSEEHPNKPDYISDAIIGFAPRDYWANQDAFLPNMRIGCPYGGQGESNRATNQMWNIPVIDPQTLFNKDGSLGKGGKLLRQKFEKLLGNYENVRIDHALGLVDPWIYDKNNTEIIKDASGKVISSNAHGDNISNWHELDPKGDYRNVLEKILLPLLDEKGIDPKDLVWEDLGCPSPVFNEIYHNKLNLPSLTSLYQYAAQPRFENGEHAGDWTILSSHDNPPDIQTMSRERHDRDGNYLGKVVYENNKGDYFDCEKQRRVPMSMNPMYLIGALYPEKTNEERADLMNKFAWDSRFQVNTKMQELFAFAKKGQVFWTNFIGVKPDAPLYNRMGTDDPNNWKLKLSKNYKKEYYSALEKKEFIGDEWKNMPLNMPQLLKRAVISKIYTTSHSKEELNEKIADAEPLIKKLDYYENMLQEPEEKSNALKSERELCYA